MFDNLLKSFSSFFRTPTAPPSVPHIGYLRAKDIRQTAWTKAPNLKPLAAAAPTLQTSAWDRAPSLKPIPPSTSLPSGFMSSGPLQDPPTNKKKLPQFEEKKKEYKKMEAVKNIGFTGVTGVPLGELPKNVYNALDSIQDSTFMRTGAKITKEDARHMLAAHMKAKEEGYEGPMRYPGR
jgi:hypothetical protein